MSREPGGGGGRGEDVLDSLFSYRLVSCLLLSGDAEHNELGSVTPLLLRDPEWRSLEHIFHVFDTQQFTEHTSLVLIRDILIPVYKQRG